eukprot:4553274-Prorocentrum_lima.AAC.1
MEVESSAESGTDSTSVSEQIRRDAFPTMGAGVVGARQEGKSLIYVDLPEVELNGETPLHVLGKIASLEGTALSSYQGAITTEAVNRACVLLEQAGINTAMAK